MQVRIEGTDLPGTSCGPSRDTPTGYRNIHVGVQRRGKPGELIGLVRADAPSATWTLECTVRGADITGPYVQGPPAGRFVYLSWGVVDGATFTMFRRTKLWLDAIPPERLRAAERSGLLVARLGLTDAKGNPRCASVRSPLIEWTTAG